MIVLDATALIALLDPDCQPPIDPSTGKPLDKFKERIEHHVLTLQKEKERVLIPTPALSELFVRAGKARADYLSILESNAAFEIVPFDTVAALETSIIEEIARDDGDKRSGSDAPWQKVKFDR